MKFTKPVFYNQWPSILDSEGANWQDFTFVRLEIEKDNLLGTFTFYVTLLGLNFSWTIIWNEERHDGFMVDVNKMFDEVRQREYDVTHKEIDTNG